MADKHADTLDGKPIHDLAALFPPMSQDEYAALVQDIEAHGLVEPIILLEGKILDGTHRLKACLETGVKPRYQDWNGEGGTPFQYVWSRNWTRRHLTSSQRAVVALSAEKEFAKVAKQRLSPTVRKEQANQAKQPVEIIPQVTSTGKSRDQAGELAGVNAHYIQDAKALAKDHPDILNRVLLGELTIPAALRHANKIDDGGASQAENHRVKIEFDDHVFTSERLAKGAASKLVKELEDTLPARKFSVNLAGNKPDKPVKPPAAVEKKASDSKTSGSRMYPDTETWSPFRGCTFDCTYCVPSFKAQARRQKQNCMLCYDYKTHSHPERLTKIPSKKTVFVCGNGDISKCDPAFVQQIIDAIKAKSDRRRKRGKPIQTFYLQSKQPEYFEPFLSSLPDNVILLTTLETNRDDGYDKISKAPPPTERFKQFLALNYPRKIVTTEPLMDFDVGIFSKWMIRINPMQIWFGLNSHQKKVPLPEPTVDKMREFTEIMLKAGIKVFGKELGGLQLPGVVIIQKQKRPLSSLRRSSLAEVQATQG